MTEDRPRVLAVGVLCPQHQHALSVEGEHQTVRQVGHDPFALTARADCPSQWRLANRFRTALDAIGMVQRQIPFADFDKIVLDRGNVRFEVIGVRDRIRLGPTHAPASLRRRTIAARRMALR